MLQGIAVNGLFWWDLVHALPRDPVAYAVRYYARYPVIAPVTYPPLFYLVEGLAFAAFGSSPYVAKSLVLVFAIVAGLYTMAWAEALDWRTRRMGGCVSRIPPGNRAVVQHRDVERSGNRAGTWIALPLAAAGAKRDGRHIGLPRPASRSPCC
jgi:hypothetical protein